MSEITTKFIKFVAEVIVILFIFIVVFSDQGIASNTFNYYAYAEPILLQNQLSTALTVGSYVPGDFEISIDTTGSPHIIKIYSENGKKYVLVTPAQESFLKTKFATIKETPFATTCSIPDQTIEMKQDLTKKVVVKKTIQENDCELEVIV